jgi:ubiquinone/menaquinone biosynthesis C-methylase UbiE
MFKIIIKLILPPIIFNFLKFLRKKIKKKKFFMTASKKQKLDVYYEKEMAEILEVWGAKSVWIEIQHFLLNKKGKILDIACGTGKVTEILSKKLNMNEVYGCDVSDFLIEKAAKRGISKDKLKVTDAINLSYDDNYFNYCYSIGSLEHFTEDGIEKFLRSSKRVTKYTGFHMVPVSKSNNDEGWVTDDYQSYFNNSEEWWRSKCEKVFDKVLILDSTWESSESNQIGKWLILSK